VGKLTDRSVQAAKQEGKYGDGDGLMLVVSKSGSKRWVLRYQIDGKRRDLGLKGYPEVSLSMARQAAAEARRLIAQGIDAVDNRKEAKDAKKSIPTFGDVAKIVIAEQQNKSTNVKVRYQWARHLGPAYCGKIIPMPINAVTTHDVADILRPVWTTKPEVARKLLPAIRKVFDHGRVLLRDRHGLTLPENPARWDDLKALGFEAPQKLSKGHHPSLPYIQMAEFIAELRQQGPITAKALEFLILTNVRTEAVLNAKWADIDKENAVWNVPLMDLKDRKHRSGIFRVPLSLRAIEILDEMQLIRESDFVFAGARRNKPLSNMAMLTFLKRLNAKGAMKWIDPFQQREIVPHGFRASFRTWAEEVSGYAHTVIEEAMGHSVGTEVERAYRRTDVLELRRPLMQDWANHSNPQK
jgi:integrase